MLWLATADYNPENARVFTFLQAAENLSLFGFTNATYNVINSAFSSPENAWVCKTYPHTLVVVVSAKTYATEEKHRSGFLKWATFVSKAQSERGLVITKKSLMSTGTYEKPKPVRITVVKHDESKPLLEFIESVDCGDMRVRPSSEISEIDKLPITPLQQRKRSKMATLLPDLAERIKRMFDTDRKIERAIIDDLTSKSAGGGNFRQKVVINVDGKEMTFNAGDKRLYTLLSGGVDKLPPPIYSTAQPSAVGKRAVPARDLRLIYMTPVTEVVREAPIALAITKILSDRDDIALISSGVVTADHSEAFADTASGEYSLFSADYKAYDVTQTWANFRFSLWLFLRHDVLPFLTDDRHRRILLAYMAHVADSRAFEFGHIVPAHDQPIALASFLKAFNVDNEEKLPWDKVATRIKIDGKEMFVVGRMVTHRTYTLIQDDVSGKWIFLASLDRLASGERSTIATNSIDNWVALEMADEDVFEPENVELLEKRILGDDSRFAASIPLSSRNRAFIDRLVKKYSETVTSYGLVLNLNKVNIHSFITDFLKKMFAWGFEIPRALAFVFAHERPRNTVPIQEKMSRIVTYFLDVDGRAGSPSMNHLLAWYLESSTYQSAPSPSGTVRTKFDSWTPYLQASLGGGGFPGRLLSPNMDAVYRFLFDPIEMLALSRAKLTLGSSNVSNDVREALDKLQIVKDFKQRYTEDLLVGHVLARSKTYSEAMRTLYGRSPTYPLDSEASRWIDTAFSSWRSGDTLEQEAFKQVLSTSKLQDEFRKLPRTVVSTSTMGGVDTADKMSYFTQVQPFLSKGIICVDSAQWHSRTDDRVRFDADVLSSMHYDVLLLDNSDLPLDQKFVDKRRLPLSHAAQVLGDFRRLYATYSQVQPEDVEYSGSTSIIIAGDPRGDRVAKLYPVTALSSDTTPRQFLRLIAAAHSDGAAATVGISEVAKILRRSDGVADAQLDLMCSGFSMAIAATLATNGPAVIRVADGMRRGYSTSSQRLSSINFRDPKFSNRIPYFAQGYYTGLLLDLLGLINGSLSYNDGEWMQATLKLLPSHMLTFAMVSDKIRSISKSLSLGVSDVFSLTEVSTPHNADPM